jgi:NAD(P)-dependent dehydrogenase (short-subunit alcohol dehydrogenase family)
VRFSHRKAIVTTRIYDMSATTKKEGMTMTSAARFAGKTAIVTGAATGIGRATLARLVAEGAAALGVDRNEEGLAESVEQARAGAGHGGRADFAAASITDEAAIKGIFADFAAREGRLDVLVNMAGVLRAEHSTEETLDDFVRILQVNLVGTFLCCREALPHLLETRGSIVNAASTSSFFGHPYMAAYAASKGGVAALTHTLAWEYMNRGVRVNAIAPGGIATPMTAAMGAGGFPSNPDMSLFAHLMRPNGEYGQPEHVAGVIAMLASGDGAFVNGEVVRVDGGCHS